jgi:hypothetical protein
MATTVTPTASTGIAGLCRTHEHGGPQHSDEPEFKHWSLHRGDVLDSDTQGSPLDATNRNGGHDKRHQRGGPHVAEELPTGEMEMAQDDQVGQVGTAEEQGSGIRKKETALQERSLTLAAAPCRVDENRRQKRH